MRKVAGNLLWKMRVDGKKFAGIMMIFFVLLTGCTTGNGKKVIDKSEDHQVGDQTKTLVWASLASPSGDFNPLIRTDDYHAYINDFVFESLVVRSPESVFKPLLAESWVVSKDSKSIVFKLRKNVRWHDGAPFTAEDVKFTYEFIADPSYTGGKTSYINAIKGFEARKTGRSKTLEGVQIIDDYTVRITTSKVYAPFLNNICGKVGIIPKHIWERVSVGEAEAAVTLLRNPIGTGPFRFQSFVPDQETRVTRNEDYWGGVPKLDSILFKVVNPETVMAEMLNGELDYLQLHTLNPDDMKLYRYAGFEVEEFKTTAYQMLVPNNQNPILGHRAVRQAFAYGINREDIVKTLINGYGTVGTQIYPPHEPSYPGDEDINFYSYDPKRAIDLLTEEAGWRYINEKMYISGEPAKFTLIYPSGDKARELSATIIQENLSLIGIEIDLKMMSFSQLLAQLSQRRSDAFELCLLAVGLDSDPDSRNLLHSDAIFNGLNFSRYSNQVLDQLLDEGMLHLDMVERTAIYQKVAMLVNEELPNIYLYNFNGGVVKTPNLTGNSVYYGNFSYNAVNWDLD